MTCCSCSLAFGAISLTIAYVVYKAFFKKRCCGKPKILKEDYEKDKVYLYQFPRSKKCPNLSPFCLKLQTIFRVYNIPHEIVSSASARSRNGTLPFIELNGEHIVDSDLIEMRIKKHFKIPELSKEDEARSVAISRMADNHLFYILIRYKSTVSAFYSTILEMLPLPQFLHPILHCLLQAHMTKKIRGRANLGIGNFNDQELNEVFHRDLAALENLLGDKRKYLFGDSVTCADATVFGQLATVYYPFGSCHVGEVIDREFPRLKKYMDDIVQDVFPNDFVL